jgi:hypothetical protein
MKSLILLGDVKQVWQLLYELNPIKYNECTYAFQMQEKYFSLSLSLSLSLSHSLYHSPFLSVS